MRLSEQVHGDACLLVSLRSRILGSLTPFGTASKLKGEQSLGAKLLRNARCAAKLRRLKCPGKKMYQTWQKERATRLQTTITSTKYGNCPPWVLRPAMMYTKVLYTVVVSTARGTCFIRGIGSKWVKDTR